MTHVILSATDPMPQGAMAVPHKHEIINGNPYTLVAQVITARSMPKKMAFFAITAVQIIFTVGVILLPRFRDKLVSWRTTATKVYRGIPTTQQAQSNAPVQQNSGADQTRSNRQASSGFEHCTVIVVASANIPYLFNKKRLESTTNFVRELFPLAEIRDVPSSNSLVQAITFEKPREKVIIVTRLRERIDELAVHFAEAINNDQTGINQTLGRSELMIVGIGDKSLARAFPAMKLEISQCIASRVVYFHGIWIEGNNRNGHALDMAGLAQLQSDVAKRI